jgi:hypothetical protein
MPLPAISPSHDWISIVLSSMLSVPVAASKADRELQEEEAVASEFVEAEEAEASCLPPWVAVF